MTIVNQITITLQADVAAVNVDRAHAALDAFFGREYKHDADDNVLSAIAAKAAPVSTTAVAVTTDTVAAEQATIELDSTGLPHDDRIHSGARSKTDAGEWRKRKGVSDAVVAAVTAELRAQYPAPSAPAPAVPTAPAAIAVPVIAPKTKYQELCAFIAAHGNVLTKQIVDETFSTNGIAGLAAIAADEATSEAFLTAFQDFVKANA